MSWHRAETGAVSWMAPETRSSLEACLILPLCFSIHGLNNSRKEKKMKKTLALLLAGILAVTPVVVYAEAVEEIEESVEAVEEALEGAAEDASEMMELTAAEMEEILDELELTGEYVEFDSYKIWIPEEMTQDELEEDSLFSIMYSSTDMKLEAGMIKDIFDSVEALEGALTEAGYDIDPIKINDMDGFIYIDEEADQICVDLFDDGADVELCFSPASDEDLFAVAVMLMGTLQKAEE